MLPRFIATSVLTIAVVGCASGAFQSDSGTGGADGMGGGPVAGVGGGNGAVDGGAGCLAQFSGGVSGTGDNRKSG